MDVWRETPKGLLGVVNLSDLEFEVRRIYWVWPADPEQARGGHCVKTGRQLLLAARGSMTVSVDDGLTSTEVGLGPETPSIILEPGTWRTIREFSSDGLALVLASTEYDSADYIRNYEDFLRHAASAKG